MLSKQAFNALLKTLEEPPEYLKFIFATTEIKKIPITVISRCQRFDLSRIKSSELFQFIKNIKNKENGKATDEALKLIVKISEGSVRDALSLLDRALLSLDKTKELDLASAQKIFGFFDKSQLIDLLNLIFQGEENKVIEIYRNIYNQGVEPKIFINDFLELLYYLKNINSLNLESTNFSLNDDEFDKIKKLSNSVDKQILILFWQFTIKTLQELEIVSNQHLTIEMFLIRLIYLSGFKPKDEYENNNFSQIVSEENKSKVTTEQYSNDTINQIKNTSQEKKPKINLKKEINALNEININSFEDLIEICNSKKEIKLKFELEKNVNLVKFEKNRIEISFNDNLDKDFVKDLSTKLFEWTNQRWLISFSKLKGGLSIKEKKKKELSSLMEKSKQSDLYKSMISFFPDAELIEIEENKKGKNDD
jgi:DNA polymerase-3 subunit gamma/tau